MRCLRIGENGGEQRHDESVCNLAFLSDEWVEFQQGFSS